MKVMKEDGTQCQRNTKDEQIVIDSRVLFFICNGDSLDNEGELDSIPKKHKGRTNDKKIHIGSHDAVFYLFLFIYLF